MDVKKINSAAEDAMEAFWAAVAKHFPEIGTGDFSPIAEKTFTDAAKNAIVSWIEENEPDVFELVTVELRDLGCEANLSGDLSGNWIEVMRKDRSIVMFGNTNKNWGGEIYTDAIALENGDSSESISMDILSTVTDPKIITEAFVKTFGK